MVTGMFKVFNYVYALIYPGATLSFATPFILVYFGVSSKNHTKPFSVSTLVGSSIIATKLYITAQSQYPKKSLYSILWN